MKLNTFSILAKCKETGMFGAAVASNFPGLGAHSPYIEADAGIIQTQGWVNPSLGLKGIQLLRDGATSHEVMNELLFQDPGRELRQVAVMDRYGNCSVYTGSENDDIKGHIIGDQYCVLGNILANQHVLPSMETAFLETEGNLAERLLASLLKGEEAGGDRRGKKAAVIKVEAIKGFPYVDFRVDDHPDPVKELTNIYYRNKGVLIDRYYEWVDSVQKGIRLGDETIEK
ncbi:DUF1028 domain-containing protein [Bacillus alveayuensis]|uniref:DUF1028 domain-containing protein n=1 Tax=Aeribacillus alveayuensis TaxID=279215 RepID=UPI0005CCF82D|nr:DUF1028 domain-containing protein [Bacillus alveayuensis]